MTSYCAFPMWWILQAQQLLYPRGILLTATYIQYHAVLWSKSKIGSTKQQKDDMLPNPGTDETSRSGICQMILNAIRPPCVWVTRMLTLHCYNLHHTALNYKYLQILSCLESLFYMRRFNKKIQPNQCVHHYEFLQEYEMDFKSYGFNVFCTTYTLL